MRQLAVLAACLGMLALPAAAAPAAPAPATSWAQTEIEAVVAAGLMAPSVAELRPDDPLTRGELADVLAGLGSSVTIGGDPARSVTVAELHAALVRHAGLGEAARRFRRELAAAGLQPAKRAGTEIVAHMIHLRTNHADETLELGPTEPVTRAETAYSVARVLALEDGWELGNASANAESFVLPELSDWQRRILTRAVSFLGHPYVWAGSSEKVQTLLDGKAPGGFDCSGFVWRVYKLEPYPDAPLLAETLRGRTTYAMSAEVQPDQRIARDAIQPADIVFFGEKGPKSKPAQIGHMGISLGNGWFIHSSSGGAGVMVSPLSDWYGERFAWARRPLAEAGIEILTDS